jgi:hypothetical protein
VKSDDTLTTIARIHGFVSWQEIYDAPENESFRHRRPNPDRIFPGDTLVIPDKGCGGITPPTDNVSFTTKRNRPITRPLRYIEERTTKAGEATVYCHNWPSQFEWREEVTMQGNPRELWEVGFLQNVTKQQIDYIYTAPFKKAPSASPRIAHERLLRIPILDGGPKDSERAPSARNIWFWEDAWSLGTMTTGVPPGTPGLPETATIKKAIIHTDDDPGPNVALFHPLEPSKRLSTIRIDQEFRIWIAAKPRNSPNNNVDSYKWLRHAVWTIKRVIGISPYGFAYVIHPNSVGVQQVGDGMGPVEPVLSPPFAREASRFEP